MMFATLGAALSTNSSHVLARINPWTDPIMTITYFGIVFAILSLVGLIRNWEFPFAKRLEDSGGVHHGDSAFPGSEDDSHVGTANAEIALDSESLPEIPSPVSEFKSRVRIPPKLLSSFAVGIAVALIAGLLVSSLIKQPRDKPPPQTTSTTTGTPPTSSTTTSSTTTNTTTKPPATTATVRKVSKPPKKSTTKSGSSGTSNGTSLLASLDGWNEESISGLSAPLSSVTCTSPSFCMTVGLGRVETHTFTFNGRSWVQRNQIPSPNVQAVSCAGPSFCVAVNIQGDANVFNGSSWSAGQSINSRYSLYSVSCPNTNFCAALGGQLTNDPIVAYTDGSWSPIPFANSETFVALSCSSSASCVAIGTDGDTYAFDGSVWSELSPIESGKLVGFDAIDDLSCSSTTFCMAITVSGHAFAFDGSSWKNSQGLEVGGEQIATSISCPSSMFCGAMSYLGHAAYYDGNSWHTAHSLDASDFSSNDGVISISCTVSGFCAAVSNDGDAFTIPNLEAVH